MTVGKRPPGYTDAQWAEELERVIVAHDKQLTGEPFELHTAESHEPLIHDLSDDDRAVRTADHATLRDALALHQHATLQTD